MQDAGQEQVIVTGTRAPWYFTDVLPWIEAISLWLAFGAVVTLVLAVVLPRLRMRLGETFTVTALLSIFALARMALAAMYEQSVVDALSLSEADVANGQIFAGPVYHLVIWLYVLFAVAQIRSQFSGPRPAAQTLSIEPPQRAWRWRFPLSLSAIREAFAIRRRVLHDPNAVADVIADPAFSPLGFRVRVALIAGLPVAVLSAAVTALSLAIEPPSAGNWDRYFGDLASFLLDALRPYALVLGFMVSSSIAGWVLVGFSASRTRIARDTYLVVDAARTMVVETWAVTGYWLASLATQIPYFGKEGGGLSTADIFGDLVESSYDFTPEGDAQKFAAYEALRQVDDVIRLLFGQTPVIFGGLLVAGSLVLLILLRNFAVPAMVMRLLGRERTGWRTFAWLRFFLFVTAVPVLLIALAGAVVQLVLGG